MSELRSAVDGLRIVDPLTLSDAELLDSVEELLTVRSQLDGFINRRLAAAHHKESTVAECGRSPRSWGRGHR